MPLTSIAPSSRLADKVCVVTGSSSGIGQAIAFAFANAGAKLVVCADLRPTTAKGKETPTHEAICQEFGEGRAVYKKTDATVGIEVEALVEEAVKLGGRLDVMANNAGIGGTETAGKIHEMTEETWDITMKINSRTTFLGCKYACGQFLRQEPHSGGHRGWIINTASMLGLVGLKPQAGAYCASKGAVVLLTKQVAVEYARDKIHCNALCPGYLLTPMTQPIYDDPALRAEIEDMTPWGAWGMPQDVGQCAVFLASEDAAYVTGVPLAIDGGYTAA